MSTQNELNFKDQILKLYGPDGTVSDGIIDIELFNAAKRKILWILKEPYGEGNFDYADYISNFKFKGSFPTSTKMWKNIIHTSHSLLTDFENWDSLDNWNENEEVFNALKAIALINLKKSPGDTRSYFNEIENHFNSVSKELIMAQIDKINPDIIICGGTFFHVFKEMGLEEDPVRCNYAKGYKWQDKIVIEVYHPSSITSPEKYCDGIINCANHLINADN